MFKLIVLIFAALFAIAAARPSFLASSPALYSVQPLVQSHVAVPVVSSVPVVHTSVVKTIVHTPVVQHAIVPVVHSVPVVHTASIVHTLPVAHTSSVLKTVSLPYKS